MSVSGGVAAARRLGGIVALTGLLTTAPLALGGETQPQAPLEAELDALVELYQGAYLSDPRQGVREDRPILMRVVRVAPPAGRRHALYMELRHDGERGEVYRQRLLLFDESPGRKANSMTALAFADPRAAEALIDEPTLLADGTLTATPALGEGCDMRFSRAADGFLGRIDPAECVIMGKSGQRRRIEGEALVGPRAIEQLERGYDLEMKLLFGNAEGRRYVWPRISRESVAP